MAFLAAYNLIPTQSIFKKKEANASPPHSSTVPSSMRVTMIDLGATACIPCKMMAPIIEELKKVYAGKADIIFIDVWKDPAQAKKYGIRAIPTQIFFDENGKEVHRNVGFMDKKQIVKILSTLGVTEPRTGIAGDLK
ncbi:MAG: hypothetical protein A2V65_05760 [Deltaproteobacteria bacterium RBG_13_49_15]|nr:MAG: hypothetical protein A2V65_05760 [Deltaproteobacteria bacterium RBG_13_49_15]